MSLLYSWSALSEFAAQRLHDRRRDDPRPPRWRVQDRRPHLVAREHDQLCLRRDLPQALPELAGVMAVAVDDDHIRSRDRGGVHDPVLALLLADHLDSVAGELLHESGPHDRVQHRKEHSRSRAAFAARMSAQRARVAARSDTGNSRAVCGIDNAVSPSDPSLARTLHRWAPTSTPWKEKRPSSALKA